MYIYFSPPLAKKGSITKIVKKQTCQNEMMMLSILKNINYYKEYFFIFDTCQPLNITNSTVNATDFMVLTYRNVELCPLEMYSFSIKNLVHAYKHSLQAISLLLSQKIVHASLNLTNIAFENNHPYILEFNNAFSMDNANINLKYDPGNQYLSPELHFVSYIQSNKIERLTLNDVLKICKEICCDEINYFKKFVGGYASDIICEILQNYASFDNYSLSKIFLFIIKDEKCDFFEKFAAILLDNTHFDFAKRLSIKETIQKFDEIWF